MFLSSYVPMFLSPAVDSPRKLFKTQTVRCSLRPPASQSGSGVLGSQLLDSTHTTFMQITQFSQLHQGLVCTVWHLRKLTHFSHLPRVTWLLLSGGTMSSTQVYLMPEPMFFAVCNELTVFLFQMV